jgi:DNA-binding response OmpR family regulator
VVVVDDDETTRTLITRALSDRYTVHDATDGAVARELLESLALPGRVPDAIVCDVMMPNVDGVELTKFLKAHPVLKRVPVVILSAKTDAQTKIRGISAGAKHYMTKPFSVKELVDKIVALVGDA